MGEIADSMIDGECCSECNTYFTEEHGYPVLCKDCFAQLSKKDRKNFSKAIYPELGDDHEAPDGDFEVITIEPGNDVFCDLCGADYTNNKTKGGIVFQSKAVCPKCEIEMMPNIKKYNEERFIRARCPSGKSFADWVRQDLRGSK